MTYSQKVKYERGRYHSGWQFALKIHEIYAV